LYELLTGGTPFQGETVGEIFAEVLGTTPRPLRLRRPDAPRALELIVERCLQKDRSDRYWSVAEVAQALAPFGSGRFARCVERAASVLGASELGAHGVSDPGHGQGNS